METKSKIVDTVITENKPPTKSTLMNVCQRCNKEFNTQPYSLNTNYITGLSSWHREMPEKIKVCKDCCLELSNVVDKWYLEKGKNKFENNQ